MKKIVNVLHVVPELGYGGVEKVVRNYYEHIDHKKYKFDYVTHGTVEKYHSEMKNQGSNIFYLKTIGQVGINGYKRQIKEQLDLTQYDIVHIHTGTVTGVYAYLFKYCGAKKIISHAHVAKTPNPKQKYIMPILRIVANIFSDRRVACGQEAGRFCFGKSNFHFLPNGIDYGLYRKISETEIDTTKKMLGISENTYVIGHVGRFSKQKNQIFLTGIIHEYLKQNCNTKFVLVGDGPDREQIESIVKENGDSDNVIFTGVRNDVPVLMKTFDLFLLPSLFEGLPVVGIEAQAAGLQCLFSDTIDKTVNLFQNNCSFLPINEGVSCWLKEINYRRKNTNKISTEEIYNILFRNGYEISSTVDELCKIYNGLIN